MTGLGEAAVVGGIAVVCAAIVVALVVVWSKCVRDGWDKW